MPITGIESILCRDLSHFEPVLFHNNPVVVDGGDFAEFSTRGPLLSNVWGGEYLSLAVSLTKQLEDLRNCAIDPLFIFSAETERRGKQLEFQLIGARRRLICLQHLKKLEVNGYINQLLPVLVNSLLVDLLDANGVSHLCSPFGVHRSCASLANKMRCALLASAHEYFLLCADLPNRNYTGFDYVPIQYIKFTPICLQDCRRPSVTATQHRRASYTASPLLTSPTFALPVHKFLPEFTSLRKVAPAYRPAMFLLLGSDAMPRIRLPKPLQILLHKEAGSDYKTRRWNAIISWLSQFAPGSVQPIDQIIASYPPDEKQPLLRSFIECLLDYLPDPIIGRRLSSFLLEAPRSNQPNTQDQALLDPSCSDIEQDQLLDDSMDGKTFIRKLFQGCGTTKLRRLDFTSSWPANLVRTFHQSQFASYLFVPLYCPGGVVLPTVVENPSISASVWDAALPLRTLFYRLLSGLEHQLGYPEKLLGLKPSATEYARHGTSIVRYSISVDPFFLDSKTDSTDELLATVLELPKLDGGTNLGSLFSLSLSLSLWHRWHISNDETTPSSPNESPLLLAVVLCAVANSINCSDTFDAELVKHYGSILGFAEHMLSANDGKAANVTQSAKHVLPVTFRLDYVHEYNSIQIIYTCFKSVVVLLDQLVPTERRSKYFHFSPPWKVFPSGRLVHWLAACIANQEPPVRLHCASGFWLPRLIRVHHQTATAATLLQRGISLFTLFMNKTCAIVEQLSPVAPLGYVKQNVPTFDLDTFKRMEMEDGVVVTDGDSVDPLEYVEPFSSPVLRATSTSPQMSPQPSSHPNCEDTSRTASVSQQQRQAHAKHLGNVNTSLQELGIHSNRKPPGNLWKGGRQQTGYADRLRQRLLSNQKESK
ncbi:hypothetical protein CRM22_005832 [Opisthorchis felineus]|uniref:Asteroid domain-containing protein n=2 Tax=Opisthorchis felineus TaxID=147828 RepID=A0A4S2LV96_OPIFE|nr:hypothetical protein CRM22_005832 [Opisthorchis felineus]TGZ65520.1 hypothetical protein CRM22_005832 [Opisthorchis felineus]TGZ65521.1 hypothetical protein CRM22_005832 [Opisthorchis felineus]